MVRTLVSRSPTREGVASIEKIVVDLRREAILGAQETDRTLASVFDSGRLDLATVISYANRVRMAPTDVLAGVRSINATFV
jgi:hypothetical protein